MDSNIVTFPARKHTWHPPAITVEMPFQATASFGEVLARAAAPLPNERTASTKPPAHGKRPWQPPAITVEMPLRETYAAAGCATDAALPGAPTGNFTPVLKGGGGADSEFTACTGQS